MEEVFQHGWYKEMNVAGLGEDSQHLFPSIFYNLSQKKESMRRFGLFLFLWAISIAGFAQHIPAYPIPRHLEPDTPDSLRTYTAFYPYDFSKAIPADSLPLQTGSRLADYLLNKPLWEVRHRDYGFRLMPLLWLEGGRINDSVSRTFINTRGVRVDGYVGRQVQFGTEITENQARFPQWEYDWYRLHRTGNGFPAIVPHFGIAKNDKGGVLDFPGARGYISYRPSRFFSFHLGHGTPFIGYGYRSLFLGDHVPPYGYFRVESRFWHLRYIVMWSVLQDVRPAVVKGGVYHQKYMATHYIDWAVVPRWHIGLFENVIWDPSLGKGFDPNFLNPVIFFKTLEFQTGTKPANTVLGLETAYRLPFQVQLYGQFLLDEMTVSKFFGNPGYWGNKYALQWGVKTVRHWGDHILRARLEYNMVRPFTYSHHRVRINYGHDNWPLAHPWGANFTEWLVQVDWNYRRWGARLLVDTGRQGLDIPGDPASYGADIYRDYEERYSDTDVHLLAGNMWKRYVINGEAWYMLNPVYRLQVFTGINRRNFHITQAYSVFRDHDNTWIYLGLRTDLFRYPRNE